VAGHASKPAGHASVLPMEQLAPTAEEMSETLGSTMKVSLVQTSHDIKLLPDGIGDTTPAECVGAKAAGMRQTYAQAPFTAALIGWWETSDGNMFPRPDFHVDAAVVELTTAAAAETLHRKFASQWRQCQATPIVEHNVASVGNTFIDQITNVTESEGLLAAIDMQSTDNQYGVHSDPEPIERAVAVVDRFLIDVHIVDTAGLHMGVIPPEHATAVAKLIGSKIVASS
jgi:hypothetical protein